MDEYNSQANRIVAEPEGMNVATSGMTGENWHFEVMNDHVVMDDKVMAVSLMEEVCTPLMICKVRLFSLEVEVSNCLDHQPCFQHLHCIPQMIRNWISLRKQLIDKMGSIVADSQDHSALLEALEDLVDWIVARDPNRLEEFHCKYL